MKYEYCFKCGCKTGKAGASEDSLYTEHEGPFCEDCFPECEAPQRKPLTDDEIETLFNATPAKRDSWKAFARAIEASHNIKENT